MHWLVAGVAVAGLIAASIVTCGGAALAAGAATAIATGTCATATVSATATVLTGAAMGATAAFAATAYVAASQSSSLDEFAEYGSAALVNTTVGAAAGAAAGYLNSRYRCFVAGTLVHTETGSVPIEDIHAGDLVWAYDEKTGDVSLKSVVETYINKTYELTHVFIDGEEIISTPGHKFYAPVKGWTSACKLRAGDILLLVNGEYVVVEKIQHELLESPVEVYNFQVEGYHTYYVSVSGMLVHNSCGGPEDYSPEGSGRKGAFKQAKRDLGIPTSEQPTSVTPNYDRRGYIQPGRVYNFTGGKSIRDDVAGHIFKGGVRLSRHFNAGGRHYFY